MIRGFLLGIPVTFASLLADGQSANAGGFLFRGHSRCGVTRSVQPACAQVTYPSVVHHGAIVSSAPPSVVCNPVSFQPAPVCPPPVYERNAPVQSYSRSLESRLNSLEAKVISYEKRIRELESERQGVVIQ